MKLPVGGKGCSKGRIIKKNEEADIFCEKTSKKEYVCDIGCDISEPYCDAYLAYRNGVSAKPQYGAAVFW